MKTSVDPAIPTVAIYNNLETFGKFLTRGTDPANIVKRAYRGDRAVFWLGDPKLVITTAPIPDAEQFCARWGYPGTRMLSPNKPDWQLSVDIQTSAAIRAALIAYAGPQRTLRMIPYATTTQFLEMVETLRREDGLTILLPESPSSEHLWVRDLIDTKVGFRKLAGQWLPPTQAWLPAGAACEGKHLAVLACKDLLDQGKTVMVKADKGESGLGHQVFSPEQELTITALRAKLEANVYLNNDWIIVEEFIPSQGNQSPSLEFFVPPLGEGEPYPTYLSNQLISGPSTFIGVMISKALYQQPWYADFASSGLCVARHLQAMGYVGHFDMDAVIDNDNRLWLLEVNARRTGGTFVHEFACHHLGEDYLEHYVILSDNKLQAGKIRTMDQLMAALDDLLYPHYGGKKGIWLSVVSALAVGEYGCIIVGADQEEATHIYKEMKARLAVV